jgi:prepilin-type N-terminal cleavage/methylation domain-containing protein
VSPVTQIALGLRRTPPRGFTLIEMLTTVAVLVIVLGLMVSLARDVRQRSAAGLTGELLAKLDVVMGQYVKHYGTLPPIGTQLPDSADLDESTVRDQALAGNGQFVKALRSARLLDKDLGDLPGSMYNEALLRDGWGTPIMLMPRMHPAIGMAAENRYFFFSAGADRRYLTRDDNLYSYDRSAPDDKIGG